MNTSTTQRIINIYNIALGANIGFLPSVIVIWATQTELGKDPQLLLAAFLIWVLTTLIVINEWSMGVDSLLEFPIDEKASGAKAWTVGTNLLYIVALLSLPLGLVIEPIQTNSLLYYAVVLLILTFVDILDNLPDLRSDKWRLVLVYLGEDVFVIVIYIFWIFGVRLQVASLPTRVVTLIGVYLLDAVIYRLIQHYRD